MGIPIVCVICWEEVPYGLSTPCLNAKCNKIIIGRRPLPPAKKIRWRKVKSGSNWNLPRVPKSHGESEIILLLITYNDGTGGSFFIAEGFVCLKEESKCSRRFGVLDVINLHRTKDFRVSCEFTRKIDPRKLTVTHWSRIPWPSDLSETLEELYD